jgi:dipeptidyl aminopeptidase/acylaminoacyl peptidase
MIVRQRRAWWVIGGLLTAWLAMNARAAVASPGPWSAAPSTIVVAEPTQFRNGETELRGTLFLPREGRALAAIVALHGASSPLQASPLYRHLHEMLPPLGIAVLIYDRRGSGRSGGDLATSDYDQLADDAGAAVRMLASDPRIDARRIGVWGLSQGGWLSLLAAARHPEIAFAIAISAPVVTPDVQMVFSSTNHLRVNGYPQAEIDQMLAARNAVDAYMRGTGDRALAQHRVDAARHKPWFKLLYMSETVEDRATSRWRKEIEHDPLHTLERVHVPTLLIYGAEDPVVPVAISVDRLAATAAKHPNRQVAVVARADHGMMTSVDAKTLLDPAHADTEAPDAPEYFAILASWLTQRGVAAKR